MSNTLMQHIREEREFIEVVRKLADEAQKFLGFSDWGKEALFNYLAFSSVNCLKGHISYESYMDGVRMKEQNESSLAALAAQSTEDFQPAMLEAHKQAMEQLRRANRMLEQDLAFLQEEIEKGTNINA